MDEYISKGAMLKNLTADLEHHSGGGDPRTHFIMRRFIKYVKDFPAADVQPVNQWISVEDRLPESEKEVLVWYKYTWDAGFTSYGFGINVWYSNAKQWRDGCLLKGVEVLYWQPLPEPPKDGDIE